MFAPREEIVVKWNQMTAVRFKIGGRHQISPASLRKKAGEGGEGGGEGGEAGKNIK